MIFIHIIDSGILDLSISGIFTDLSTFFFWSASEREMGISLIIINWWLPITTTDITINYFYCIIVVSQSSSLFILSFEGDLRVLALNISNIGLGFMEIMQLTCVASWLAGFLYIQVLLGIFQMNSQSFLMSFQDFGIIPSTLMVAIWSFKIVFTMILVIKCLFDLEITY